MSQPDSTEQAAGKPARFSFYFMLLVLALVVGLRLATPLLGALFTFLALTRLAFFKRARKWLAVGIFLILLAGMTYAVGYVINQTVRALPEIAENSIYRNQREPRNTRNTRKVISYTLPLPDNA
jgi:cell division protein FtsW (lipid II flippase)